MRADWIRLMIAEDGGCETASYSIWMVFVSITCLLDGGHGNTERLRVTALTRFLKRVRKDL